MRRILLTKSFILTCFMGLNAQVTRINSNKGLEFAAPLGNNKVILVSGLDQTLWITDATSGGTSQLSTIIAYEGGGTLLNGRFVFTGATAATGTELYVTDGTTAGTRLLNDIFPGTTGSTPDNDIAILNGHAYFTAARPLDGRELWRTDGTPAGTTLVKDIVAGPDDSNEPDSFELFSTGSYLLFAVRTATQGTELWRSDGTSAGTVLLKDIYTGAASSNPQGFYPLGNTVLFGAEDAVNGPEIWKTDGTTNGTTILKDIRPGAEGSRPLMGAVNYFTFNNKAFFSAGDGVHGDELWSTDGTTANTQLLADIEPGPDGSFDFLANAIKVGNKFIFPSTNFFGDRFQLWESDGTPANTRLFKSFDGQNLPLIMLNFDINGPVLTQPLYQGNKFFFVASTASEGYELWISDGTIGGTHIVKDINSGIGDGVSLGSFIYTTAGLYFSADNGTTGNELWQSDGTLNGTLPVADINPGGEGSEPQVFPYLVNNKILLTATDGDNAFSDLYVVNGTFTPLPVKLMEFVVSQMDADAILQWRTAQELNSRDFTVQRSFDGVHFIDVGVVAAAGNSSAVKAYRFTDAGIINGGHDILYYRLKAADKDGKTSLSSIISLKLKDNDTWKVQLLTNPTDQVQVLLTGVKENVQLSILDMSGRKLYTGDVKMDGQISLPTRTLLPGTYILVAVSGNKKHSVQFLK